MKIFVYGTLKKGFRNHYLLQNAKFLCDYRLSGFVMGTFNNDFPFIIRKDGIVYGELYEITPEILEDLDILEGHPDFYVRILINDGTHEFYIYVMSENFMENVEEWGWKQIPEGNWI